MGINLSRAIGYIFAGLCISLAFLILLLSVKEAGAKESFGVWFIVILCVIYMGGLIMAFWKELLSGIMLTGTAVAIGLPNSLINPWAGLIFGLPPLIAGLAFLSAAILSLKRDRQQV